MPFEATRQAASRRSGRRSWPHELDLSHVQSDGYAFQIEVTHAAWRLGWKIEEVPITFVDRHAGTSKMSARIVREAVWRVPALALRGRPRRREQAA